MIAVVEAQIQQSVVETGTNAAGAAIGPAATGLGSSGTHVAIAVVEAQIQQSVVEKAVNVQVVLDKVTTSIVVLPVVWVHVVLLVAEVGQA